MGWGTRACTSTAFYGRVGFKGTTTMFTYHLHTLFTNGHALKEAPPLTFYKQQQLTDCIARMPYTAESPSAELCMWSAVLWAPEQP
jgi:hypothetical protein